MLNWHLLYINAFLCSIHKKLKQPDNGPQTPRLQPIRHAFDLARTPTRVRWQLVLSHRPTID